MIGFIKKLFVFAIGVISMPLVVPATKAFYLQLLNISVLDAESTTYFLWGAGSYIGMHLFLFKPNYIYNLGHEVVHVLSTWLSFGKAKNMKVSGDGGSVQTSKSNFFINISPYFIPVYTLLLCGAYFLLSKFYEMSVYSPYFIFSIGFTFAMHIIMTVDVLKTSQPDLLKTGYLLSLSLIYVFNIFIAGFVIGLIFTGFSFVDMAQQFLVGTKYLYLGIYEQLFVI